MLEARSRPLHAATPVITNNFAPAGENLQTNGVSPGAQVDAYTALPLPVNS